jgi:hypothetical protein
MLPLCGDYSSPKIDNVINWTPQFAKVHRMEGFFSFILIVGLLFAVFVVGVVNQTRMAAEDRGLKALRSGEHERHMLDLDCVLVDAVGRLVGLRAQQKQLVIRSREGELCELPYSALRAVTLTPEYSRTSYSDGEVRTRTGSAIVRAGLGAAVAGPVGAIIGGLSAPQISEARTEHDETVSVLELEMFFRDERHPRFVMHGIGAYSVVSYEVSEAFKDMAARLANVVDRLGQNGTS